MTENKGAAVVVAGSNDVNVQILVNAINDAIGANGTTINFGATVNYRQGIDTEFATLVDDMNAGKVNAVLFYGANPVYTWPAAEAFKSALAKVKTTISFSGKLDETAAVCKYVIPDHHYLESWGDAEPVTGHISFIQPTIAPLFKTRAFQDSLLKWSGNTTEYINYVKNFWSTKLGSENAWNKALQAGVINPETPSIAGASINGAAVAAATTAVAATKPSTKIELALYQKVGIGAGQGAANPWLQELPDPVTRATWDNYIIVSPAMARTLLNIDLNNGGQADAYEVQPP
ncbi:MAG: [Fe-S]-binding protein, partial [Chitinophagia bacterium]|nr:[Fe-S]-binding protein [Chitinophagia bacterium]